MSTEAKPVTGKDQKMSSEIIMTRTVDGKPVEEIRAAAKADLETGTVEVEIKMRSTVERSRQGVEALLHEVVTDLTRQVHRDGEGAVRSLTTTPATEQ